MSHDGSDHSGEIAALEERLRAAMLAGDVATLDALISDRLLFAGPTGQLATKEEDLRSHRDGLVKFLRHEPLASDMRRASAECWVVSQATRLEVRVAGTVHRGTFRYTHVWVREPSGWRILAGQVAAVQEPAATSSATDAR